MSLFKTYSFINSEGKQIYCFFRDNLSVYNQFICAPALTIADAGYYEVHFMIRGLPILTLDLRTEYFLPLNHGFELKEMYVVHNSYILNTDVPFREGQDYMFGIVNKLRSSPGNDDLLEDCADIFIFNSFHGESTSQIKHFFTLILLCSYRVAIKNHVISACH